MKLVSCPQCDGVKRFVEFGTGKHFCEECDAELDQNPQATKEADVALNVLLAAVETMAIALDMAQAFIRNEKLEKDIVLKEIDMALVRNPVKMESI